MIDPACQYRTVAPCDRSDPLQCTLTELEQEDWGQPKTITGMVQPVYRLRHVPLKDLTPQDLIPLIWEDVGLTYLIPLALEAAAAQPYDEQTCLPSKLLFAVLCVPRRFWATSPELTARAVSLARIALEVMESRYADQSLRNKSVDDDDYSSVLSDFDEWLSEYHKDELRRFVEVVGGI